MSALFIVRSDWRVMMIERWYFVSVNNFPFKNIDSSIILSIYTMILSDAGYTIIWYAQTQITAYQYVLTLNLKYVISTETCNNARHVYNK